MKWPAHMQQLTGHAFYFPFTLIKNKQTKRYYQLGSPQIVLHSDAKTRKAGLKVLFTWCQKASIYSFSLSLSLFEGIN